MTDSTKDWTIMVYMAGDNNLSENMAFSLEDFSSFGTDLRRGEGDKINLLAFFDGNSLTAPTHYIDYSDGKTLKHPIEEKDLVHSNRGSRNTVQGGENSASAYSILNFINWCINTQKRAAKNYALVFSAHSFGFHGTSFLSDGSSGDYITIFGLKWALEEANRKYLGNQKIAVLGFDSCVMSMLEVGYELKDVAQTIVASEGSLPNSGWGYAPMLRKLVSTLSRNNQKGTVDYVKEAAKSFVEGFIERQKKYAIGGRSVDIAAWNLDEIEPLAQSLNELAVELLNRLNLPRLKKEKRLTEKDVFVYEQLKKSILQSHMDCQTYMYEQCVDLKDFCERLLLECKCLEEQMRLVNYDAPSFSVIGEKCGNVIEALGRCVLKSGFCGDEYQFSNGISLYFPWTALAYSSTHFRYRYLSFIKGTVDRETEKETDETAGGAGKSWDEFLYFYLFVVTMRRTRNNPQKFQEFFNELVESPLSKDNWSLGTRDNWSLMTRDNWSLGTKDNWSLGTRDNWSLGTRGEFAALLSSFGRFKNYQLDWEISGFSDAQTFDEEDLRCKYFELLKEE